MDKAIPVGFRVMVDCDNCGSRGYLLINRRAQDCRSCKGIGRKEISKEFEVELRPGVINSNYRDILSYDYKVNNKRLIPGRDVVVRVNLKPNLFYTHEGKNLICEVPVGDYPPGEKTHLPFPTLEDPFSTMKVLPRPGDEYSLPNRGGYISGDEKRGDIIYRLVDEPLSHEDVSSLGKESYSLSGKEDQPEDFAKKEPVKESFEHNQVDAQDPTLGKGDLKLIGDLLPIIDSLEKALESISITGENSHKEGIQLILDMYLKTLGKHGVEVIIPLGEKFNPHLHEAMSLDTLSTLPKNTVTEVIQTGYRYNKRLIRPARVRVSG